MRLSIALGFVAALGCCKKADVPAGGGGSGSGSAAHGDAGPQADGSGSAAGSGSGSGAGSGSAADPGAGACFPGSDRGFVAFAADDKAATLCTAELGSEDTAKDQVCLAVDLATGTWRRVASAPPATPPPPSAFEVRQDAQSVSVCQGTACKKLKVPPPRIVEGKQTSYLAAVSDDGKRAVLADDSLKGAWLFDAVSGKRVRTLTLTADGGCMDTVGFLGEVVYAAVNVCAGPGAEGKFYSWAGKEVGHLEKVNPYGAPPIHLAGTSYAFADLNGEAIEIADAATLKTRAIDIPPIECEDCVPFGGAPVGGDHSLIRTASGRLVDLSTKSVAVTDAAATRIDKQHRFPMCPPPKK